MTRLLVLIILVAWQGGPSPNGIQLRVQHVSGMCLAVNTLDDGAVPESGTVVIQWVCHAGLSQGWFAEPIDRYWRLRSLDSGQCLDVPNWSMESGTVLIQWPCNDGENQQWRFESVGVNTYHLIARHSGLCLDVPEWSGDVGRPVIQWSCNAGLNQQWEVIERR